MAVRAEEAKDWPFAVEKGLESWLATWALHNGEHPDLLTECLILANAYAHLPRYSKIFFFFFFFSFSFSRIIIEKSLTKKKKTYI